MDVLVIVLRIVHIFSGIFWVGFALFNFFYFQPAIRATGAEGMAVMQHLNQKTKLMPTVYLAATLTFISGLTLFWPLAVSIPSSLHSSYGIVISVGSLSGIIAWILAIFLVRKVISKIQDLGIEIQTQEGPPTADQQSQMNALAARLNTAGKTVITFMVLAVLGMSTAQYANF
jgi:uncharacterized membrane protein